MSKTRARRSSLVEVEALTPSCGQPPGTPRKVAGARAGGGGLKTAVGVGGIVTIVLCYIKYGHLLTMEALRKNQVYLRGTADEYPVLASSVFLAAMMGDVALSLPGSTLFCFMAGLTFPQPLGAILAWLGFGLGSCLCFVLVQSVLGDYFRAKLESSPKMLEYFKVFKSYLQDASGSQIVPMLCVRYMIFIPHWFTNATAALVGVPFFLFFWTTMLACIPGCVLYVCAGTGLAKFFEQQQLAIARGEAGGESPSTVAVLLAVVDFDSRRDMAVVGGFLSLFLLLPLLLWFKQRGQNHSSSANEAAAEKASAGAGAGARPQATLSLVQTQQLTGPAEKLE